MLRWIRLSMLFVVLLFAAAPAAIQAESTSAAPRLVVFEGFYNPG